MRGKSHLAIGLLTTIEVSSIIGIGISPINMVFASIFSVLPDIDESNSSVLNNIISKKFTKQIHKVLLYTFLITLVYFYMKTNDNLYIILFVSIFLINIIEKKITENFVRSSFISLFFLLITLTLIIFKVNLGIVLMSSLLFLFPISKHRSISHSIIAVIFIFIVMKYLESIYYLKNIAVTSTIAYLSHIICDAVTKRGIPILYPFSKKFFSFGNLKVGSIFCNFIEWIIIFVLILILIFLIWLNKLSFYMINLF